MIYFVGCSYTWGAGLQWEYLYNEENYSVEQLHNMDPSFSPLPNKDKPKLENTNYYANEYRKKHRFANLVAKKLNKNYEVLNMVNGGSNKNIEELISTAPMWGTTLVVVQFTEWLRDLQNVHEKPWLPEIVSENVSEYFIIEDEIKAQIQGVTHLLEGHKFNWLGFSWRKDLAEELIKMYPENHIPIILEDRKVNSFEEICKTGKFNTSRVRCKYKSRISDSVVGSRDTHFSREGHKLIANSILRKCEGMEI